MKHIPLRMCINCRARTEQRKLIRFMCKDSQIVVYDGAGRSFYLCKMCIEKNDKSLKRSLSRTCKREIKLNDLETLVYG